MLFSQNLYVLSCLLFIFYKVNCIPASDEGNDNDKDDVDSSEKKSSDKDVGTVSPGEMEKLKEEIIENQEENAEEFGLPLTNSPEEIEHFLKVEEEEFGTDLPEKIEESITDGGELNNFVHFVALFDQIKTEATHAEEEVIIEKSEAEMQEMKQETLQLTNELWKKLGRPEVSDEEFDAIWEQYKNLYGRLFPWKVEQLISLLRKHIKEIDEIEVLVSEAAIESSTSEMKEEEIPKDAFALENSKGKVCILAKFHSVITITYEGKSSEQKVEVSVPPTAHVKGKCAGSDQTPELHLSWEQFSFKLFFDKISEETWGVTSVELNYDTSGPLFDGSINHRKVSATNKKRDLFETPIGKSYFCPAHEVLLLYSEDQQVAIARLKDLHLQPYGVEDEKFSTSYRCDKVVIDAELFVQDETVPLAVGSTLAIITLLILVAFSVHRAYTAARADYNNMDV